MTLTGYIVGTKGNTGRGIASIVENADYTITINLTDGTSYTTAPIAGFTAVEFDENYDLVVTKTDGTEVTVETDLGDYEDLLAGYKSDAESAKADAESAQTYAETAKSGADASALKAEQWAKGTKNGTPVTSGDDGYQDNSKYYKEQAASSASSASSSATSAGTDALAAEGFAYGEQNGEAVSSGSPYYHNNAKYYKEQAYGSATNAATSETNASGSASSASTNALKAEGYSLGKQNGTDVASGSPYYHNNAKYYSGEASTSATSASGSATSANTEALKSEGYAAGKQNGVDVTSDSPYYENNAKYYSEEAAASAASLTVDDELDGTSTNPVQNKVIKDELDSKANIDGYYESLGSGTADQLASNIYEEDNTPYNFRTSGGSIDIGDRETDMVVGGTVAWNQLVNHGDFDTTAGWARVSSSYTSFAVSGNVGTITITDNTGSGRPNIRRDDCNPIVGHKYAFFGNVKVTSSALSTVDWYLLFGDGWRVKTVDVGAWTPLQGIFSPTGTTRNYIQLYVDENVSRFANNDTIEYKDVMLIDLTAMFGSTIADYIYSLEQANAGAGVAWFRKLFPKPYYAYNAGELMSVNTSAHNTVGFNAWDEEWELGTISSSNGAKSADNNRIRSKNKIQVVPNASYYIKTPNNAVGGIFFYDANDNYIGVVYTTPSFVNGLFTTPTNASYLMFTMPTGYGTTYNNDICINLSWDGERDGEYEEYVKHSYPLDIDLVLRGIPKLDASNNLYYDGDIYASDGTVTRKYAQNELSALTWIKRANNDITYYTAKPNDTITANADVKEKFAWCSVYTVDTVSSALSNMTDNSMIMNSNWAGSGQVLVIRDDSISTVEALVTKLTGKGQILSNLKEPITETADPYTNPQIVNDFGTEEYVDYAVSQSTRDVAIPVGHETQYMANLKAKLEMSPSSPEGAGDYIVRQTNGENEYVTLASNATIQDIIARLEALEGGGE